MDENPRRIFEKVYATLLLSYIHLLIGLYSLWYAAITNFMVCVT